MKKILSFLLAILCLFALCACKEKEHADECTFQATVLEVHDTYLLVEPAEGSPERSSSDKIEVSLKDKTSWPIPQVGEKVNVFYNAEILETYPARVGKVFRVEIVA